MQLITPADAAGRVTAALKGAAEATGAGFDYLLRTAKRESSLDPTAQAPTSSARGLFQFIDQTWLEVLKEEGPKLGLAGAAADVSKTAKGKYTVSDPARKAELLALRDDPQAAALLAGAFTRRNADAMTAAFGRAPSEGELYAAHFLGAQGAIELVTLATNSPSASAADAFPAQASANRAIFFEHGRARSASEVYGRLTATPTGAAAPIATAEVRSPAAQKWVAEGAAIAVYNNGVENDRAAFHSMFKTGRRSPVSAYVAQAWSAFGNAGLAADVAGSSARTAAAAHVQTVAAAYAPQKAAAVERSTAAAAAVDAVTVAAARKPRRMAVPKTSAAAALPYAPPAPTPAPSAPIAKVAAPQAFDLGAFLRSILTPSETSATKKGGKP